MALNAACAERHVPLRDGDCAEGRANGRPKNRSRFGHTCRMPGYDGTYRGVVLDTSDPMRENRVQVQVPNVAAAERIWARPQASTSFLPSLGDEVTIHFENGDENYPIWRSELEPEAEPASRTGLPATYRGVVIDNIDPSGLRRVCVQVPDVSTETMWATAEDGGAALPAIGDEVSIRFQNGDVQYPQWSGGSGTGEQPSVDGTHQATVIGNQDPEGLGRLYVSVPGVTDGVWASPSPEQAPPAVGDSVSVTFEGSTEHARWSR